MLPARHEDDCVCVGVQQVDLLSLVGEGRLRAGLSVLAAEGGGGEAAALYRLSAAVLHVGGPRSGHFATYRRGNGFEAKRYNYKCYNHCDMLSSDTLLLLINNFIFS